PCASAGTRAWRSAPTADPRSVLNATRAFLRWRKAHPALREGAIRFLDTPEPVLAFVRECDQERLLVAFNLSANVVAWSLPPGTTANAVPAPGVHNGHVEGQTLHLPAHGAFYATLG
ncbi:MAG TPA: alpha-glucosidase C-terminal domain-containing protein, partial [Lysobacter sp.]|nr:alpha-glucosidase C-terminal domain-containing protein [Lysobacter sp.]